MKQKRVTLCGRELFQKNGRPCQDLNLESSDLKSDALNVAPQGPYSYRVFFAHLKARSVYVYLFVYLSG